MTELLTPEEISPYLAQLYARLLEHRYRYYVLAAPVLDDWIYDWLERHYNALASQHGAVEMDMVDWTPATPGASDAAYRVNNKLDWHSLWEAEMIPIWERLGKPKCLEKKESSV